MKKLGTKYDHMKIDYWLIPPEVIEWNAENQWLTADHPLRGQINEAYSNAIAEGKTIAGALRAVDRLAAQLLKSEPAQKKTPRAILSIRKALIDPLSMQR
jgi:hypothetical protein